MSWIGYAVAAYVGYAIGKQKGEDETILSSMVPDQLEDLLDQAADQAVAADDALLAMQAEAAAAAAAGDPAGTAGYGMMGYGMGGYLPSDPLGMQGMVANWSGGMGYRPRWLPANPTGDAKLLLGPRQGYAGYYANGARAATRAAARLSKRTDSSFAPDNIPVGFTRAELKKLPAFERGWVYAARTNHR